MPGLVGLFADSLYCFIITSISSSEYAENVAPETGKVGKLSVYATYATNPSPSANGVNCCTAPSCVLEYTAIKF